MRTQKRIVERLRILTVNKIMQTFFLTYSVIQVTYGILYSIYCTTRRRNIARVTYHRSLLRRTRLFRLLLFCFIIIITKITIIIIIILVILGTCLIKKRVALVLYFREIQQLYILTQFRVQLFEHF